MTTRIGHRAPARAGIAGLALLWLLSTGCAVQPLRVEGRAMEPALKDGEPAVFTRVLRQLERGDIVVLRYPRDESKSFVKRIVGLPGERIAMANGTVTIGGRAIDEPYVERSRRSSDTWGPITVPEGAYFVMGDNRRNSSDSRHWGTVRRQLIWGRVILQ